MTTKQVKGDTNATKEILSNSCLMKEIKESLEEERRGEKGTSLEELKKELEF